MFGLIVLIVFVVYLSLLVWATRRGWRWGIEKKGWAGKKRYLGAGIGFLIVYLPVFWDWLPTVAVQQYYCAKDSGFWVYKTLERWKKENPGVAETLVANKSPVTIENAYVLNQRFNWVIKQERYFPLNYMMREEQQVVDSKTGEILARYVDYSASNERRQAGWSGWKLWLDSPHCIGGKMNDSKLYHFFSSAKHIGEGENK